MPSDFSETASNFEKYIPVGGLLRAALHSFKATRPEWPRAAADLHAQAPEWRPRRRQQVPAGELPSAPIRGRRERRRTESQGGKLPEQRSREFRLYVRPQIP